MLLVLDDEVEKELRSLAYSREVASPFLLRGFSAHLNLDEDLMVLESGTQGLPFPLRRETVPVACYVVGLPLAEYPSYPEHPTSYSEAPALVIAYIETPDPSLKVWYFGSKGASAQACQLEVVHLKSDLFSRVRGVFDTLLLTTKTVCVIGLGSGGSLGVLELAKTGVGNFILVDFDRLGAHNISRHVCGLSDVGRFKTRAMRDAIWQHHPEASVTCYESDVTQDEDLLESIVGSSDLVFVATDNEISKYMINEACLAATVPAVYGGVYERAFAGEIVRIVPGESGCYTCVRQGMAKTMRSISTHQVFDYTEDEELQAEPGLGLDVSMVAMIHAKLALTTLLRGTGSMVADIDADMIIWVNSAHPEDGDMFSRPLTRHLVRIAKDEGCPSCGLSDDDTDGEATSS